MTMQERVTWAVVLVLGLVGAWYGWAVWSRGGPAATTGATVLLAVLAITVLSAVCAGIAALAGSQRVDERDRQIAFKAQVFRGYGYLALAFGALGFAFGRGDTRLAVELFAVILAIEFVSGIFMAVLYRRSA